MDIKYDGIENLKQSSLIWEPLIDTYFTLAQHSSFIVTNNIIKDIFNNLRIPPINKRGSCFYERNFGLYFINKFIQTID